MVFLIIELSVCQHQDTPSWSLVPEPQGLSSKDTQQRVTVVRTQDWEGDFTGLKQAARAFQAKGTAGDKHQEVTMDNDKGPSYFLGLERGLPGGEEWGWKSVTITTRKLQNLYKAQNGVSRYWRLDGKVNEDYRLKIAQLAWLSG